jgi:predicted ATPase
VCDKAEEVAVILVTGMSGTDKSTVLTALCQQGYRVVDTDFGDWIEGIPVQTATAWSPSGAKNESRP